MKFGSVCSGIEAASVAWEPLGWKAAWFSEIEPFPCAVLKHHYPDVPNLGDMTKLPDLIRNGQVEVPDLLCGGTPCQAFSVAGLRRSLSDERGNLSLTFCEIADAIDEKRKSIIFWENVPGVLNTKDNAFGCFLAGLAGEDEALIPPRGRWTNAGFVDGPQRAVAWRVLDAQYFGVAQRRRRVFVVASARADFDPAAVLFEFDGVRRDSAPSREAGQGAAPTVGTGAPFSRTGNDRVETDAIISMCLNAGGMGRLDAESETLLPCVAPTIEAVDGRKWNSNQWVNNGKAIVSIQDVTPREKAQNGIGYAEEQSPMLDTRPESNAVVQAMQVRRLTPVECERLQGFPDGYTNIPWRGKPESPDGPRYKALGNSWAVPVVRWIGERIARAT
jgi:DNA (cytosine-5)-methyltransferase 1